MGCSMPGFPVCHQLPKFAQTHVYQVSDAVQPSHPLSSPSPPPFSLSQHQGLFWWVSSSHQVAKVSEFQLQHQSFQWIFRIDFLLDWLICSPGSLLGFLSYYSLSAQAFLTLGPSRLLSLCTSGSSPRNLHGSLLYFLEVFVQCWLPPHWILSWLFFKNFNLPWPSWHPWFPLTCSFFPHNTVIFK